MAIKGTYPVTSKSPGLVFVCGYFLADGANAPTVIGGSGFTVEAPVDGVYKVTLTDGPVPDALGIFPTLADGAADSTARVRVGIAPSITDEGWFQLITQSEDGVDGNLSGVVVMFVVLVRNTGVTR